MKSKTQMKTSHYAESFDLRHPQTLGSEHSNNQISSIARNSNISSELTSRNETIAFSLVGASVNYSTAAATTSSSSATIALTPAYGSNSSNDHQHHQQSSSHYEKSTANELLIKNQQRQQQHPEQNKKRKRETGEYFRLFLCTERLENFPFHLIFR